MREAELGIWGTNSRHRLETGKEIGYQVTSWSWFMDLSYLKYGNISRGGVMIIFDLSCSVYSAHATSLVCLRILQQLLDSAGQACTCLFVSDEGRIVPPPFSTTTLVRGAAKSPKNLSTPRKQSIDRLLCHPIRSDRHREATWSFSYRSR